MEKSNFDQLMKRYLANEVSREEKIKIEAWLDMIKTEGNMELSKADEEKLFQKIASGKGNVEEIEEFHHKIYNRETGASRWVLRIAASLLLISAVAYGVWIGVIKNHFPASNAVEKMILNDGSLVWLKGQSQLTYYNKPAEGIRYAELKGEALFEVAKDANHPFVIHCGEVNLKVLGTSFSVKSNRDTLELKVLTGIVNISSPTDREGVDVEPNEKVMYTTNHQMEVQSMGREEVTLITANTEYNMSFTNQPLKEASVKLERKFDVNIKLASKKLGECRITANLTDHSLESSLQILKEVLDIEETRNGSTITLSGDGCK